METVKPAFIMRDPAGSASSYSEFFSMASNWEARWQEVYDSMLPHSQLSMLASRVREDQEYLRRQYGVGVSIESLQQEAIKRIDRIENDAAFVRTHGGDDWRNFYPLLNCGYQRESIGFMALVLLSVRSGKVIGRLRHMIPPVKERQIYLFDLLLHAYDPMHRVADKYFPKNNAIPWLTPIARALALPVAERPLALAKHMNHWQRLMRPYHWSPDLKTAAPGSCIMFYDFAYEVALAACAYDVDDSSFSNHPYYPRDLANYYREHLRHSRDQWRPLHVGADLPIMLPPPAKKADLLKSKRKGIARWVELVADGDIDAILAVLEATGKPRKIYDLLALLQNLEENHIAIYADWGDDVTVEVQASGLSEARGLGIFDGPPGPPYGAIRCDATLVTWSTWLAERGYQLAEINDEDSDWHAVVVKTEFYLELQQLSEQLGIPVRPYGADRHLHQE